MRVKTSNTSYVWRAGVLAALAAPAYGYTDPGTGLMVWQIIGAAFVGSLFYIRRVFAWFSPGRRARKDSGDGRDGGARDLNQLI